MRGDCLYWSQSGGPSANYVEDFRAHLKAAGARTRQGSAIAVHLLMGVSPSWIAETGGIHDGQNSRIQALFSQVKSFAETHVGGVFAMRLDLDERGGGVVDVYAAPVHDRKGRTKKDGSSGRDILEVSVKKMLLAMQAKAGGGSSFGALQTLWADHAAKALDSRLVRGAKKAITGREHLDTPDFRESVEREKAHLVEMAGQKTTIFNTLDFLSKSLGEANQREAALDYRQSELEVAEVDLTEREMQLTRDLVILASERQKIISGLVEVNERMALALAESARAQELQTSIDLTTADLNAREFRLTEREQDLRLRMEAVEIREANLWLQEATLKTRTHELTDREATIAIEREQVASELSRVQYLAGQIAAHEAELISLGETLRRDQTALREDRNILATDALALNQTRQQTVFYLQAAKGNEVKARSDAAVAKRTLVMAAASAANLQRQKIELTELHEMLKAQLDDAEVRKAELLERERASSEVVHRAATEAAALTANARSLLNQAIGRHAELDDQAQRLKSSRGELAARKAEHDALRSKLDSERSDLDESLRNTAATESDQKRRDLAVKAREAGLEKLVTSKLEDLSRRTGALNEQRAAIFAKLEAIRTKQQAEFEARRREIESARVTADMMAARAAQEMRRAHDLLAEASTREMVHNERERAQKAANFAISRRTNDAARRENEIEAREGMLRGRIEQLERDREKHRLESVLLVKKHTKLNSSLMEAAAAEAARVAEHRETTRLAIQVKWAAEERQLAAQRYVSDFAASLKAGLIEIVAGTLNPKTDMNTRLDLLPARSALVTIIV